MPHSHIPDIGAFPSYDRNLPHRHPIGFPLFVTWNLDGALPAEVLHAKEHERRRLEQEPVREGESIRDRHRRHGKLLFAWEDQWLDRATEGVHHLRDPRAAQIVVASILFGVPERYDLFAFAIMSNHVHVLLTPRWLPRKVMQGIKGYTSREINRLLRRSGALWQHESYDHWARDAAEMDRIIEYIENNPVKAGLCKRPEDWLWSSAAIRAGWPRGEPYRKSRP
jgi:putative transposase